MPELALVAILAVIEGMKTTFAGWSVAPPLSFPFG
jgi:hypothetical protein